MLRSLSLSFSAIALFGASGCLAVTCDPLDPSLCVLPYPNDFYIVDGKTDFSNTTWPEDSSGKRFDVSNGWNGVPGFSPAQPLIAYLPNASLDADAALPRVWDIAQSLKPGAHSALIDASTGERVAHWVETDHSSDAWDRDFLQDDRRALLAWPAHRLRGGTRYVYGISHVVNYDGTVVAPSTAFKALRDKIPYAPVEKRRAHFESDIFPLLETAGINRSHLSLAWDFTTAPDETFTADMISIRDQTLSSFSDGAQFKVTSRQPTPREGVAVELAGLLTVPWYLSDTEPKLGTHIVRDSQGKPQQQGTFDVDFRVIVPESVANGSLPGTALYYGHGLFGSESELEDQYLDDDANNYGWVMIGVNWLGLCRQDVFSDAFMIADDLSLFSFIQARLHQAQSNALLAHRSLFTSITSDPALQLDGKALLSKDSPKHYYGNSLGGIMGSVFMSLTQDVERGVLGVPGGPFSLLLPRSKDFAALFDVIRLRYNSSLERAVLMNAIQEQFTYLEPGGYANRIAEPFPNTPKHTVLIHYGEGDAQVNWLAAEWLGRTINNTFAYESTMRVRNCSLFGFNQVPDSATPSGSDQSFVQGYYFDDIPADNIPLVDIPCSSETDTHSLTRKTLHAREQTHKFFHDNVVVNTCGGPCHEQR